MSELMKIFYPNGLIRILSSTAAAGIVGVRLPPGTLITLVTTSAHIDLGIPYVVGTTLDKMTFTKLWLVDEGIAWEYL